MSARTRTVLVSVVLLVLTLVVEFYALTSNETGAWTFSRLVWDLSGNPLFVFLCGGLAGHFFFPKTVCLHCGSVPYRRSRLSEAAFDRSLLLVYAGIKSGMTIAASKRPAGLPDFEVKA